MSLYQFFRYTNIDSLIIFTFLLYTLFCLLGMRDEKYSVRQYLLLGSAIFYILYAGTVYLDILTYSSTGSIPTHPSWYYFACTFFISSFFAHFYLNGSLFVKITYILYYIAMLQLYQYVCSPLYNHATVLPEYLYMLGDVLTTVLRYFLLYLFSVLLKKNKIPVTSIRFSPTLLLILYFPASLLIYYQLKISYIQIKLFSEPILAAVILLNLPIMYYLFSYVVKFYDQKRKLSQALHETKNQLSRYRYSIELEERIKKERHELKNNYLYIQSLLRLKQYDQLDKYLSSHIAEHMEAISSISTGNLMIDYLLNHKLAEARKKGIRVYMEILIPDHLPVAEETFGTIFLNLIDNAIEASQNESQPDIHISFKVVRQYLSCSISNKVNTEKILANPDFNTTKASPENHGFGRTIVDEAIKSSNGIFQDTLEGNYYTVKFMLPLLSQDQDRKAIEHTS